MIDKGHKAPDFETQDHLGNTVKLSDFVGKNVVLFFYPKDMTPGCTIEACSFRDHHQQILGQGAVVLGVGDGDIKLKNKFALKHNLPFPLLQDQDYQISKAYGVYKEKKMFGKTFMGINRATYLIGPDGNIARNWPNVSPNGHAGEVLDVITDIADKQ